MRFSVIVPCYNLKPWISQCLDSVMNQSYKDWECIIVDDESKDQSNQIIDNYVANDNRFKVVYQKNMGEGGARNSGLSIARGEWVFFLDGDDLMYPNTLSRLSDYISDDDQIICFGFNEFNDGEKPKIIIDENSVDIQRVNITHEIKMKDFFTYVWQHIYRRSIIKDIQFKRYKRGCDRVYLSNVLLNRIDNIKNVNFVGYLYRKRQGSAMNTALTRQVFCDEMDHRLDIMEMIDNSKKKVDYAGDHWLEKYLIEKSYWIIANQCEDKIGCIFDWRQRLSKLRKVKGLSRYGYFVAFCCSVFRMKILDFLLCYVIPRFRTVGSPIGYLRRRFFSEF